MPESDKTSVIRYRIVKTFINVVIITFVTLFFITMLNIIQDVTSRKEQRETSQRILGELSNTISQNKADAIQLRKIFHTSNRQMLADLKEMFSEELIEQYLASSAEDRAFHFSEILDRTGVEYLYVIDSNGTVVIAPKEEDIGKTLESTGVVDAQGIKSLEKLEIVQGKGNYEGLNFYSLQIDNSPEKLYIILGEKSSILDTQYDSLTSIKEQLESVRINKSGFVFATDLNTQNFLYFSDGKTDKTGQNITEAGLGLQLLDDGYVGIQKINNINYYCVSKIIQGGVVLTAAVPTNSIYFNNMKVIFWTATIFIMVMIVSMAYAVFVHNDFLNNQIEQSLKPIIKLKNGNAVVLNRSVARKYVSLVLIGIILIFCCSMYFQTLLALSVGETVSSDAMSDIEENINESNNLRQQITDYYERRYLDKTKVLSYMVELNPEALNQGGIKKTYSAYNDDGTRYTILDDEGNPLQSIAYSSILQNLCDTNDLEHIYIVDDQGRTIAVNGDFWYFTVSRDQTNQSYPFLQVVDGRLDSYIQSAQADEQGKINQYVGTDFYYYTTKDKAGNTLYVSLADYEKQNAGLWKGNPITKHSSMFQSAVSSDFMSRILNSTEISYIINNTHIYNDGFVMAFSQEEGHPLIFALDKYGTKQKASDFGLDDDVFSGSYKGFRNIDGKPFYICCYAFDGYYLCAAIPESELYYQRFIIPTITTAISFITLLILGLLVTLSTDSEEKLFAQEAKLSAEELKQEQTNFTNYMNGRKMSQNFQSFASKFEESWYKWKRRTPEQKMGFLIHICLIITTVYLFIMAAYAKYNPGTNSLTNYIISGNWEHKLSIFSISACVVLMLFINMFASLIQTVIYETTSILGSKSETIGKLINSFLLLGGRLVGFFYCLYLIGLDASSLIASAGILSVIIGFGAQSVIGDILAGIFIVFEGEFSVGDIVTIDGFRGYVVEIGLRTTKIQDTVNNIKIFDNSKISEVLNMSKRTTVARCEINVSYDQPIEKIELALKEELPGMRKAIPLLLKDPVYRGVVSLADSGVVIRIQAECEECNRHKVIRALNREILRAFRKHGITIPFPQVTVSQHEADTTVITDEDNETAKEFASSQILSTNAVVKKKKTKKTIKFKVDDD